MRIQHLALAATLAGGLLGPLAATPAIAAAKVYATANTAAVNMSASGGVPTTILTLAIPAGSWLLTAKADAVNFGNGDIERCGIKAGSTLVDQSSSSTEPASAVVNVESQGTAVLSTTTSVTLYCQHDQNISGEYIDPRASLIAQKVPGVIRQ